MNKISGADELRNIVSNMDYCNENFNQTHSLEELIQIFRMHLKSEWDFFPDQWTSQQIKEALQGIPPYWSDNEKPICGARLRGIRLKNSLLKEEGGLLSEHTVMIKLHFLSVKDLNKLRLNNKIFGLKIHKLGYSYPAWQFDKDDKIIFGFDQILPLLKRQSTLVKLQFFLSGNSRCGGNRPLDCLWLGDLSSVKNAAKIFREHECA